MPRMPGKKELILTRVKGDSNMTAGVLIIIDENGWPLYSCNCIERGWQDNEKNISSIPRGTYEIVLEYSPRFGRDLWEIKGVPNRSECKIHASNYWHELNGCIAPGEFLTDMDGDNYRDVANSRKTLKKIHRFLKGTKSTNITIF